MPQAQVLGSEHNNPLETLIIVSGTALVMLITSTMWAVRKYIQASGEKTLGAAQADLVKAVSDAITRGDEKIIEAVKPIVVGIIQGARESALQQDSVDIDVAPGLSFGINRGTRRTRSKKRRSSQQTQEAVA
jgi:hypothetical protein